MSTEPHVLFVKPRAINARGKKALAEIGVVVIETEDPQAVNFVRPKAIGPELPDGALLYCAAKAALDSSTATIAFGKYVAELIVKRAQRVAAAQAGGATP